MFMDPHQSQQHAGLQHVILQVQHEISRPKESFKLLQLLCFPNSLNFVFFSQKNESNAGIDVAQNNQWMGWSRPNETLYSPHLYSDSSSMLVICCFWCRFVVLGVHLLFLVSICCSWCSFVVSVLLYCKIKFILRIKVNTNMNEKRCNILMP